MRFATNSKTCRGIERAHSQALRPLHLDIFRACMTLIEFFRNAQEWQ